jgi:RNA polymerase sigma factor (sigma-70 family)
VSKHGTSLKRALQMALPVQAAAPDRMLLRRFADEGDQEAFAALVRRHTAMVLGVCRRALPSATDAEDACQATFVILAEKAKTGRWEESVANWLFTTARRVARDARRAAERRRKRERRAAVPEAVEPIDQISGRELLAALDEELDRLPPIYREALVLFYLEHSARDEIAARLGVPPGTVKIRLERGRKKLGDGLTRRGVGLGAGLLALAATSPAGSPPPRLVEAILAAVSGHPPAAVAALVEGVAMNGVIKRAMLTAVGVVGIAALSIGVGSSTRTAANAGNEQPPAAKAAPEVPKRTAVSGRVLGPGGKPVAGAKLYLAVHTPGGLATARRATSGEDGRFRFLAARSEVTRPAARPWERPGVLACAPGYGPDWVTFDGGGPPGELTLRLVEDHPIRGRILDQDGRPVAGARVRVESFLAYPGDGLDKTLDEYRKGGYGMGAPAKTWNGRLPEPAEGATTDAAGRFRLRGLGRERLVQLRVEQRSIAHASLWAVTLEVAKPVVRLSGPARIYGATFDHLAAVARPIRGVVRDQATGKPLAGVQVRTAGMTFRTDAEGRFEVLGCGKSPRYVLQAQPADGQLYFTAEAELFDTPGLGPLSCEFKLIPGIPVRGRAVDRRTGKAVAGARVYYYPLRPNPFVTRLRVAYAHAEGASAATTGKDGSFALAALPGPGVLAVESPFPHPYMSALLTRQELVDFLGDKKAGSGDEHLLTQLPDPGLLSGIVQRRYQALALLNPGEKTQGVKRDVELDPGRALEGVVTGPDGKPLRGATLKLGGGRIDCSAFRVSGLNPRRTYELLFEHPARKLALCTRVRGDQAGPLTARLEPYGSVTGRILDRDGQPVPGAVVHLCHEGSSDWEVNVKTGGDGRFRADGLVPGQKYWATLDGGTPLYRSITIEAGKVKNLGDARNNRPGEGG